MDGLARGLAALTFFACIVGSIGAWGTHVYKCLTDEQWGFLIAGAIMAPVAVVHGVGIWMGVW